MVHLFAGTVFVSALVGGIALTGFMIASRLDAIVAALDPLPETTRILFIRPAILHPGRRAVRRSAMLRTGMLRRPLRLKAQEQPTRRAAA